MNKPIKHSIQQHFNSKQLSDQQLHQLQLMEKQNTTQATNNYFPWLNVAVLASVVIISLLSFYFLKPLYFAPQNIELRIAEEVAGNHLKLKPLEIKINHMQGIQNYFKHLDFLPVKPTFLDPTKQTLIGGRYCSIQGVTAAQLRIKDKNSGAIHSLYETLYDKRVFSSLPEIDAGEQPLTVYAKGIKVKIWVEKGVLFALTDSH